MTFSIVARAAGAYGVAVASKYLAVGAVVPAAQAGAGALATQSYANPVHRPQGLTLLRTGVDAAGVVAALAAADPDRAHRQLGVVAASGPGATFTGEECLDWAGGEAGDGWAVQGNILAGPQVVTAMRDAWCASGAELPLARRLLAALVAGDAAGGDRRGRQSAAVLVVGDGPGGPRPAPATEGRAPGADAPAERGRTDPVVDLRVDDHDDPVGELARLLDMHTMLSGAAGRQTRPEPTGPLRKD